MKLNSFLSQKTAKIEIPYLTAVKAKVEDIDVLESPVQKGYYYITLPITNVYSDGNTARWDTIIQRYEATATASELSLLPKDVKAALKKAGFEVSNIKKTLVLASPSFARKEWSNDETNNVLAIALKNLQK